MSEKFETDFLNGETPKWVADEVDAYRSDARREAELHIRQFALDMAVTALPSLVSDIDPLDRKFDVLKQACTRFEKILRGDES